MRPAPLFIRAVLLRDWQFLLVTVAFCTVAATVATFQFAVYNSFKLASAVVPHAIGADFWVKAESVDAFDFPTPFPEDYGSSLARYLPEARMRRIVVGFAPWRSPTGRRGNVAVVGIEGLGISPTGFVANSSDLARLDIPASTPSHVEATIGDVTLSLERTVDSLPTYLGAPYVLADIETARALLGMDPTLVSFLAGQLDGPIPSDFAERAAQAQDRFPEVVIVSAQDFSESSINYWQNKTGAGLAIGLASVLALLLMILLMANGVLRFIQRYHSDLISLLGHGADRRDISMIVVGITIAIGAATLIGSAIVTPVLVWLFNGLLPWARFAVADLIAPIGGVLIAFLVSTLGTRKAIAGFSPDAVFRS